MPIEIRELVIKAVVSDSTRQPVTGASDMDLSTIKKEIVKECVEKVLQAIKEKSER